MPLSEAARYVLHVTLHVREIYRGQVAVCKIEITMMDITGTLHQIYIQMIANELLSGVVI